MNEKHVLDPVTIDAPENAAFRLESSKNTKAPETTQQSSCLAAPALSEVPAALANHPRYRVLRVLGKGGMGTVFQAEHKLMDRFVALKVIRADLTSLPEGVERFQREVKAAAMLDHPNIVRAFDAEQAGDTHLLVMEYIDGIDLARLLTEHGPLALADACNFIRQAALGLQHAHEHQMVHRDLKPHNLIRTSSGEIKILDFGLARMAQASTGEGTGSGVILGTPDYLAPEQANDARSADIRADIYSLGCVLYHLLSGRPPFPGGGIIDKLRRHAMEQPTSLAQQRPGFPDGLIAIVAKMMAKEPARRYATPSEVAEALAPWCQTQPATVELPTPTVRGRRMPTRSALSLCVLAAAMLLFIPGLSYYLIVVRPASHETPKGGTEKPDAPTTPGNQSAIPKVEENKPRPAAENTKAPKVMAENSKEAENQAKVIEVKNKKGNAIAELGKPWIDDDFSDPGTSGFTTSQFETRQRFFHENRYVMQMQPDQQFDRFAYRSQWWVPRGVFLPQLTCRVTGRVQGGPNHSWAIYLIGEPKERSVGIYLRQDGRVEVNNTALSDVKFPVDPVGPIQHAAIRPAHEFNILQVSFRDERILELQVNGVAITEPIELKHSLKTAAAGIGVVRRGRDPEIPVRAEFSRFTVWRPSEK